MPSVNRFVRVASMALVLVALAGAQQYVITDLGTLGDRICVALGVNNFGEVAGYYLDSSQLSHAFFWTKSAGMQEIKTIGFQGGLTFAAAINASGEVAGYYTGFDNLQHPFLWRQDTGMHDLGSLGGDGEGNALGIGDSGQVVGTSYTATRQEDAFLWKEGAPMHDLRISGSANAINRLGEISGTGQLRNSSVYHAFIWTSSMGGHDLGSLGGTGSQSYGLALNNLGEAVGISTTKNGLERAFRWSRSGGMRDLGILSGGNQSWAYGINDSSEIVGASFTAGDNTTHALLWTRRAGMQDLNSLIPPNSGWVLTSANAINAVGQIVGGGTINGQGHAFLLTPQSARNTGLK
jgi:probable HAF family extracellular repeat protein